MNKQIPHLRHWLVIGFLLVVVPILLGACGSGKETPPGTEGETQEGLGNGNATVAPLEAWHEDPANLEFIRSLPTLRVDVYDRAGEKWNTGITSEMHAGNRLVIDFLKDAFVRLAAFYPERRFEDRDPQAFIDDYVTARGEHHNTTLQQGGAGGTLLGVMVGGAVMADLEDSVSALVAGLAGTTDALQYALWKTAWEQDVLE